MTNTTLLEEFFDYFTVNALSFCEQDVTLDEQGHLRYDNTNVGEDTLSLYITVKGVTFEHEIEDVRDEHAALLEFALAWEEAGKPKIEDGDSVFFMDEHSAFTKGEQ